MGTAEMEASIARAHRAVWLVWDAASMDTRMHGLEEDCRWLLRELERIQASLLSRPMRG